MNWWPNFLSPGAALLAAAAVIPSLLLLYFLKLRRRQVVVSSTLLWKKSIQDLQVNAPFQRLRRNLLLLLQLLLLGALLLAMARPVAFFTPGAGRSNVILIDRSASMNAIEPDGRTRLEIAKLRARQLLDTMSRNDTAMVVAFDDRAETVQSFTTDTQLLRRAIDSIGPTDRPTRLKLAYQLAEAQTNFDPQQLRDNATQPEVWLFSDGRASDAADLGLRGNLRFEPIGSPRPNIGLVSLNARRNLERPTEVQVFARLVNHGERPVPVDVELAVAELDPGRPGALDFRTRAIAVATPMPARWSEPDWAPAEGEAAPDAAAGKDSVEFKLDLTSAAVVRVRQTNRADDALAADDEAFVVVSAPRTLAVTLVTDATYGVDAAGLLRGLWSLDLRDFRRMTPSEYAANPPSDRDVIVFDRFSPSRLPDSGNFVYFESVPPGNGVVAQTENDQRLFSENVTVLDWNRDHPILRGLSLRKLFFARILRLRCPPQAEVLMEGSRGPLLVLHREPRRVHLVAAFDTMESNWPMRPSFGVFLSQMMEFLAAGAELSVRGSFRPGETPQLPRTAVEQALAGSGELRVEGLGGSRTVLVPAAGDVPLPPLERVGLYSTHPAVPGFEYLAVSLLDENESHLAPLQVPPGNIGTVVSNPGGRARLDLWWWLVALGALPLLLLEWWVYTRRVHL
jgi:hypothetical protein